MAALAVGYGKRQYYYLILQLAMGYRFTGPFARQITCSPQSDGGQALDTPLQQAVLT